MKNDGLKPPLALIGRRHAVVLAALAVLTGVNSSSGEARAQGAPMADLAVTKTGSPNTVAPGGAITYTVTVKNNGPDPSFKISLTDLPSGTAFESIAAPGWTCSTPPVGAAGEISCTTETLPPQTSSIITIVMRVSPTAPSGQQVTNLVAVGSRDTPDPNLTNNTATATNIVLAAAEQADLAVTKTGSPNTVAPGGTLTYTVTVTNNGPDPGFNVSLNDIPSSTAFESINAPGWTCSTPPVGAAGEINCTIQTLPPKASSVITIVVRVNPTAQSGQQVTNVAAVGARDTPDPNLANNTATATNMVVATPSQADLAITMSDSPDPVASGERLSYTLRINNLGPDAANNVAVVSPLPPNVTLASITPSQGTCQGTIGGTQPVQCGLGVLAAGGTATIEYRVNVLAASGSTLAGASSVSSQASDPKADNNAATTATLVQGGAIVTLVWKQPQPTPDKRTPPPTELAVKPGGNPQPGLFSEEISAADACSLVRINVYKSNLQPVLTVPDNLWKSVPPDQLETTMAAAPGGSFYVITNVWNCEGTEVESGGSNEAGVPAGPTLTKVKIKPTGKMKISGASFTDPSLVFLDGIGFSRTATFADSTLIVQKGALIDGRLVPDVVTPGRTVIISVRSSNGGISSIAYTQP